MNQPLLYPTATPRERGGRSAREAGKSFEQLILASQNDGKGPVCSLIKIESYALWIPNKPEVIAQTGQRMRMVAKASHFDFSGVVFETEERSAIGVFFDAKSFDEKVASFPACDESKVKPHQLKALEQLERAGAFAGFLVKCGRMKDYRWIWAKAALEAADHRQRVQWDDPCWDVLGPVEWGRGIPLRKLFEGYR